MATQTPPNKAVVYIDVDDEITHIIDKVKASDKKIIALVLPKRASVMQSVVNMKLLKRAAQHAKKNVVLVTSETALMPLAGAAGLHVAKSPSSKPTIPPAPKQHAMHDEPEEVDDSPKLNPHASIGALAATVGDDETETIELDNSTPDPSLPEELKPKKTKKLKHLKVPNFERFRIGFFLAGLGLVMLIVGWYFAVVVMPQAKVTIKTDTSTVVSSFDFTASTSQTELDIADKKLPATKREVTKIDTEKVVASGEKDIGTKASGTMNLTNCINDGQKKTVPAGTSFTSGNFSFVTTEAVTLSEAIFSGQTCRSADFGLDKDVSVVAAAAGDTYNLSARNYTSSITGIRAAGSDMSGGTTNIVKVVAQKDIDDALTKMKSRLDETAKSELNLAFEVDELFGLNESLLIGEPKITAVPAVNEEASEVTVSSETMYAMLGIKREDLKRIIEDDIKGEVDIEKQKITDDGIESAIMRINSQPSVTEALISFRTSVTAGPEIKQDEIKEAIRGKKRGEAEQYISGLPGVQEVIVDYSPFWVYSTPKATKKITIVVEKVEDNQERPQSNNE